MKKGVNVQRCKDSNFSTCEMVYLFYTHHYHVHPQ
jgi:hypothetical protein